MGVGLAKSGGSFSSAPGTRTERKDKAMRRHSWNGQEQNGCERGSKEPRETDARTAFAGIAESLCSSNSKE